MTDKGGYINLSLHSTPQCPVEWIILLKIDVCINQKNNDKKQQR